MATVGIRRGKFYIDFRYKGVRYREQTDIVDNAANRKSVNQLIKKMDAEITLDTFDHLKYFPKGKSSDKFKVQQHVRDNANLAPQVFECFAEVWFNEKQVEWSDSYRTIARNRLDKHIIPFFKGRQLAIIDKAMIMQFRSEVASMPGQGGGVVTASCVNNIMLPLRQILREGADRFNFPDPWKNIRHMKERRKQIVPFSMSEVQLFLGKIRPDFKAYYTTRFFTGLRSGEVDGLKWKYIDFERKQILVREALVQGKMVGTKTDGSMREVDMSSLVYETLIKHKEEVGRRSEFVFSTATGGPLHNRNVTRRVWYPMLRYLGLEKRRPYQTRHTAATLWLAAGENPEWIARQMGHTTTKMLFQVYSRYVPNLTRQDGSAFERLLQAEFNNNKTGHPSHDTKDNTHDQ